MQRGLYQTPESARWQGQIFNGGVATAKCRAQGQQVIANLRRAGTLRFARNSSDHQLIDILAGGALVGTYGFRANAIKYFRLSWRAVQRCKCGGGEMMDVKPLHNEQDYDWAIREITRYFEAEPMHGTADGDRFEVLSILIKDYEDKHFTMPIASS